MARIVLASDDFNRPDEVPLSDGGAWLGSGTSPNLGSNTCRSNSKYSTGSSKRVAITPAADQYATVGVAGNNITNLNASGPLVRGGNGTSNDYRFVGSRYFYGGGGYGRLYRNTGGTLTQIGSDYAIATVEGTTSTIPLDLEASGSTLTPFDNGVALATQTDSTHTTGYVGLSVVNGNSTSGTVMDNWEGGNLSSGAPPVWASRVNQVIGGSNVY